jgi:hypothetical protein
MCFAERFSELLSYSNSTREFYPIWSSEIGFLLSIKSRSSTERRKEKKLTIFVELNPKLERAQTRKVVEEWQGNLLNCCGIEFGAAFVRATTIIVTMQNGANSFEFAKMMRQSEQCYSYKVEKVEVVKALIFEYQSSSKISEHPSYPKFHSIY